MEEDQIMTLMNTYKLQPVPHDGMSTRQVPNKGNVHAGN